MVAASEDRLSIRRNPHTSFAAVSDCRTIAIYEYTPLVRSCGQIRSCIHRRNISGISRSAHGSGTAEHPPFA
jgi:hypothetical protein